MTEDSFGKLSMVNRVALVTGGGSGIGRATARLLAARGAALVVADIDERGGEETVAQIARAGGEARYVRTDVTDEDQVAAAVAFAISAFGGLHAAFNNAGIVTGHKSAVELSLAEWQRNLDINLTGVFLCVKHEVAHMLAHGGGAILNNSSSGGIKGFANSAAYVSAKHGVIGLTKATALDCAAGGIRVNALLPGGVDTPMMDGAMANEAFRQNAVRAVPAGRFGRPEEQAETAAWLLSDAASYVTGASIMVDGGVTT